jgi:feruloyl-CoA synthase
VADDAPAREVLAHPAVRSRIQEALRRLAADSTGSSTFVARAILLDEPPSADAKEITDKGSLNQKAVLANRAALVDELYANTATTRVISAK